ncbi:beta-ketoacyl-ACP synthase II [Deinococcus aquiradiocola]|uniref:3-oxoacyl-[acyl-carrier-protein] synthase 2 n=1 Tax=Deinococcus aquiradiocola TaxID=393059 RepID=A0A917PRD9_9DEIO|nr:beta-ketoacyl-ACP synthase II [Deinococcus aquiradiocola]GGJ88234.1 3-oxoacyl-[acyl-carrier-protein] synthase 2 [Deinococcus aquiradiocola]
MKRVVITGMGPVTPIGIGEAAFAQAQREGRNGIGPITRFDISNYPAKIAGQINDDLSGHLDPREAKRMDRFVQLALIGADLAVQDSGLTREELAGEGSGTIIGTGVGGMETWEEQSGIAHGRGANRVSPMFIPMIICNMASGHVAMRYGLTGPSSTVVTACATGSGSIGDAFRTIQLGLADIMLTGGTEAAITPMSIGSFGNMKALSTRNDTPETASRPFTASRDGFVLGEGAGILVLEELEHALARGARIHAELVGYATSADAYHITMPAPEGRGAQVAMRAALRGAGVTPEQVGYINAHGTSTPANDLNETLAIQAVYGDHAATLAVSSTKSMTGHLLGAAGAIEAIATAQALRDGILPPTINFNDPDPQLTLDFIPNHARQQQVEYAMSNSFAFGGQNAVLLLKRWQA